MSLLELFAAALLVVGSVLVLWTVIRADVEVGRLDAREAEPHRAEADLGRAA